MHAACVFVRRAFVCQEGVVCQGGIRVSLMYVCVSGAYESQGRVCVHIGGEALRCHRAVRVSALQRACMFDLQSWFIWVALFNETSIHGTRHMAHGTWHTAHSTRHSAQVLTDAPSHAVLSYKLLYCYYYFVSQAAKKSADLVGTPQQDVHHGRKQQRGSRLQRRRQQGLRSRHRAQMQRCWRQERRGSEPVCCVLGT